MAKLTVIIPFYQKEPGILERALRSVFAQNFNDFDIIVVDDESPYPADGDIIALLPEDQARVRILRQENAGPGATLGSTMSPRKPSSSPSLIRTTPSPPAISRAPMRR
jgi:succinoglycan biosynthesis protein ExoW